ncbi:MAG TPA: GNAT family N-acetyltransferase [Acidimicrobiia bacterium]|nr:GNAT family N-acetyltransferase [Acidimicrobiia bacterium]
MTDDAARAHANLVNFVRWQRALEPDAHVLDADGVVATAGTIDFPSNRMAVRASEVLSPEHWVATADRFFTGIGKSACIFLRLRADDDLLAPLVAHGYAAYEQSPEMVCRAPLAEREPPDGFTLRLATTPDDIAAFAAVAAEAFKHLGFLPDTIIDPMRNTDVMLGPSVMVSIAERDGAVVAGAVAILLGDEPDSYVGWVSCADSARGNGLGDHVTRLVTNESFRRGARLCTLEASRYGESTYRRMGYEELYRYQMLIKV